MKLNNKEIINIYKITNTLPYLDHLYYIGATRGTIENKLKMFNQKARSFDINKNCFNLLYQIIADYGIKYFKIECIYKYEGVNYSYDQLRFIHYTWGLKGNLNYLIDYSRKVLALKNRKKLKNLNNPDLKKSNINIIE